MNMEIYIIMQHEFNGTNNWKSKVYLVFTDYETARLKLNEILKINSKLDYDCLDYTLETHKVI